MTSNYRALRAATSRRTLLGGLVGAASSVALSGCLGAKTETSDDTLQVWGAVPAESGPGAVVEAFTKKYPQYKVNYTRYVNDADGNLKLDTALQGGLNIDVYFTYRSDYLALRTPLCADLTDRIAADPVLAPMLNADDGRVYKVKGRALAIATNREPYFVAFNADAGRAAGIDVPHAWTLDEFVAGTRKLTKPKMYGAYTIPDTARIALGPNYWYVPGAMSNFANPAFADWLGLGQQLINDKVTYPWTQALSQKLSSYQQSAFTKGEFAQWVIPPALVRYLHDPQYPHDFKVAAAPLPTVPGTGNFNQGSYNNQIMIHPKSKRQDLAWTFTQFWLAEGGRAMLAGGKIPVVGDYSDDEILQGILGADAETNFDVESFRRVLFAPGTKLSTDTELAGYAEISAAVTKERNSCWINEKTPQAAADAIRVAADAAIKKARG